MAEIKLSKPVKMTTYLLLLTIAVWVVTAAPTLSPNATTDSRKSLQVVMKERYGIDVSEILRGATEQKVLTLRFAEGGSYLSYDEFLLKWREWSASLESFECTGFGVRKNPDSVEVFLESHTPDKYIDIHLDRRSELAVELKQTKKQETPSEGYFNMSVSGTFGANLMKLDNKLYEKIQTAINELIERAEVPLKVDEWSFDKLPKACLDKFSIEKSHVYVAKTRKGMQLFTIEFGMVLAESGKIYRDIDD